MPSPIPTPKKDDPEDVSWALTTAETQWARGDHAEALKWLRRAAESASEAEADMRALELAKAAAEVATQVAAAKATARKSIPPAAGAPARKSIPPAAPVARKSGPPPAPVKNANVGTMGGPTKPAFMPVKPAAAAKPTAAKVATPTAPKPVVAKTTPGPKDPKPEAKEKEALDGRKTARRSYAGEVQRGRGVDDESTQTSDIALGGDTEIKPREPIPTKPPEAGVTMTAADADAWPTEALPGDALPVPTFEAERTRIGALAYKGDRTDDQPSQRTMQAVRVMLYRGPDGALRVAAAGSDVSAVAIEAMLVSLDPDVDLPSWLKVD